MSRCSIYQIIHTLDGEILHLDEHLKILFEAYYQVFSTGVKISKPQVESLIEEAIEQNRCPQGVSLFIELLLDRSGKISVGACERSLYRGYTLRCISPRAALVEYTLPHIEAPTSVRRDVAQYAATIARQSGGDLAIRSYKGYADMIGEAQLFAARDNCIITAEGSYSVEHKLAIKALGEMGVELQQRPVAVEEIAHFDELFFVDHYGVTAIKCCGSTHYMSIMANSLAKKLSEIVAPRSLQKKAILGDLA
ncbi:MAG: aminotransferase class IV [Rikenellaceae bacterium]